jgi:hypothetical protein
MNIRMIWFIREGERKYLSAIRIPCCKYAQTVDKGSSKSGMQPWVCITVPGPLTGFFHGLKIAKNHLVNIPD